ncbi:carbohydrate ABC transporter permease [Georgenia alba]|uniref:Carbohydrate ABC transporter permease n=1 Tax=Georgenia alba TaxID=2233858 RepID=A0ABW2Q3Q4_9MICO
MSAAATREARVGRRGTPESTGGRRRRPPLWTGFVLSVLAILVGFPFLWLVLTSLRTRNSVFSGTFFPESITFDAYGAVWEATNFPSHFLTSLVLSVLTVVFVVALASLSGYAFARLRFPGRNVIYLVLLSTLMMPATALILPLYLQLRDIGLLDTREGLLLLYVSGGVPFAMFLMRAFFSTVPIELAQAARIDGASEFQIFWRIYLPLTKPGIATVVIFQFLSTWNEFLYANTVLQSPERLPLQPVLFTLIGQYQTDWPMLTAGLVLSIVPVVLVYVRMQKQFVAGMTMGAVKE